MEKRAYLSLGSNVGDRKENLRTAIRELRLVGNVLALSSFYETEPVEFTGQPWFLNCALVLETRRLPSELLRDVLEIESRMGRRRTQKKGPRTIDIDILLFADVVVKAEELTIPHPALQERRFVLEPLAEIAPEVVHPVLKRTVKELRDALPPGQQVRRTRETNAG